MSRIAVVNYGMGNLRSVQKALETVGLDAGVTSGARAIKDAGGLILPGVGAFGDCMKALREKKLVRPILDHIGAGKPFLGICLGLQVLLDESSEFGRRKGLGLVPGKVKRFPSGLADEKGAPLKIPHMGWNRIAITRRNPLFKGVRTGSYFYFVHSYYAETEDPADTAATSHHGLDFTAAVWRDNIFACQFHPEKSQALGLKLLANFGRLL